MNVFVNDPAHGLWAVLMVAVVGCSSAKAQPDVILDTGSSPGTASVVTKAPAENEPAGKATLAAPEVSLESTRSGEDWPQFLGPRDTGVSGETGLLDVWTEAGPPLLWERRLGEGYAPPSVVGERLVIMHRLKDREIVECLHAQTGDSLWKYDYDTDFTDPYGFNGGTRCSPALSKTHSYTLGPQGKLLCLNLVSGEKVWEHYLQKEWKVPDHFFGFGCSPILYEDKLIVLVGGQPNSAVVAFESKTGKVIWEHGGKETWEGVPATSETGKRPYQWTGEEMLVSYSTPVVATIHGKPHLLCLLRQGLVSLDPANGEQNFKYWFRPKVHESVNAARPIVVDDKVLITAAYEAGSALLKVQPDGKSYDVVWRAPRGLSCHWSTPIAIGGYVYGFSGRHEQECQLQCVQIETAELAWESNGLSRPLDELEQDPTTGKIRDKATGKEIVFPLNGRGSLLLADGKFIIQAERGPLSLVKPGTAKLEEISRASYKQMGYPSWAAPILSRGRLYLRSESHVICLDVLKPKA